MFSSKKYMESKKNSRHFESRILKILEIRLNID